MEQQEQTISDDEAFFFKAMPMEVRQDKKDQPLFKSIGGIICLDRGIPVKGTAFLVTPFIIVTSAHLVHAQSRGQKGLKQQIVFYPRAFGDLGKGIKIKTVQVCEEYIRGSKESAHDFAYCLLEYEVPKDQCIQIGYNFDYEHLKPSITTQLHIYGYPGQNWKKLSPEVSKYEYNVFLSGLSALHQKFPTLIKKIDLKKGQIKHCISTLEGQGGSPIIAEIDGNFIAIGLVKGAKYKKIKEDRKQPDYNLGVLFNQLFIQKLEQFIKKHQAGPIDILNLKKIFLFWDKKSILPKYSPSAAFEIKNGQIVRTKIQMEEKMEIRSLNLKKVFLDSNVLKLRLCHFHYDYYHFPIEFGVIFHKQEKKEDVIKYLTHCGKKYGIISKERQIMFKEGSDQDDQFISQTNQQFVDVTVDLTAGVVYFDKIGFKSQQKKNYKIQLDKWSNQKTEVFLYTHLCGGASFEVQPMIL